jgi:signal transduction histidine kinase/DNA-binding response OmpR family regulator
MNSLLATASSPSLCEAIVASLRDAILILDADGRIESCNDATERLFARTRTELTGRAIEHFLRVCTDPSRPPGGVGIDHGIAENVVMVAVERDGRERLVDVRMMNLDGDASRHCVVISDKPVPCRLVGQTAGINNLQQVIHRATAKLVASHAINEAMTDALAAIGACLDVAHGWVFRVRTCGEAQVLTTAAQWHSADRDEDLLGLHGIQLLRDPWLLEQLATQQAIAFADVLPLGEDARAQLHAQGVKSMVLVPIWLSGELTGILAFDETCRVREWHRDERVMLSAFAHSLAGAMERMRSQRSLDQARRRSHEALARAEAASEAKSEFLANISHELRTPLTAIVGYADLAAREATSHQERMRMCGRIQHSSDFLLGLINDVLDLAKIESGKLVMAQDEVSVAQLVGEVVQSLDCIAQEKRLALAVDVSRDVPPWITSDAMRLRQILVNLVANALKFTHAGGVTIEVHYAPTPGPAGGSLRLSVRDTGIGIPRERMAELFRKFSQVHRDLGYGGTGLGLAIVLHLVRLLGGDVRVESELARGSTFTVELPVSLPSADNRCIAERAIAAPAAALPTMPPGTRILVADDNEDNREIFRLALVAAGAEVTTVRNGQQALDELLASESRSQPYAMALMDMNMPAMDGYQAVRFYRKQGGAMPIVAVTAFSMASDRNKCIAVGCDGYLSKPIRPDALVHEVTKHTGKTLQPSQSLLQGDRAYQDLLAEFQRVVGLRMQSMRASFVNQDRERLRAQLHQLRGSAGCYGFVELVAVTGRCEARLRRGMPIESVAEDLEEIAQLITTIEAGS